MNTIFVEDPSTDRQASVIEFIYRARTRLRQLTCGVAGHDMLMHYERKRVSLVCSSCGYESPGWSVTGSPVRLIPAGRESAHHTAQPHLTLGDRRRAA